MGPGRIRPHLEEGRNAGAYSGRKRIRGSGKTAKFQPAIFQEFRNIAETPVIVPFRRAAGEESRTGATKAPPVRRPQSGLGPCDPAKDPARNGFDPRPDPCRRLDLQPLNLPELFGTPLRENSEKFRRSPVGRSKIINASVECAKTGGI